MSIGVGRTSNTCFVKGVIINRTTTCFRLLCFAIIRLLHYLLDTYMCKSYNGLDILVISRENVAGNVVGMIRIISKFMT
jgi:hypothetical protein